MSKLRNGDRVRVTFEATVERSCGSGLVNVYRGPNEFSITVREEECVLIGREVQIGSIVNAEEVFALPYDSVVVSQGSGNAYLTHHDKLVGGITIGVDMIDDDSIFTVIHFPDNIGAVTLP